jgi:hypothetical protein
MSNFNIHQASDFIGDTGVNANIVASKQASIAHLEAAFRTNGKIGDAFNLGNLAKILTAMEYSLDMSPQMAEATAYSKYVPVNNSLPGLALGSTSKLAQKSGVGVGKAFSGTGGDIPLADIVRDYVSLETRLGAIAYQYSMEELAAASLGGINLDSEKYDAAVLGYEKHMGLVALYGEASTNLKGLINQAGVTAVAAGASWATATVEQILTDVNNIINDAIADTEYSVGTMPNTLLIASNLMRILSTKIVPDSGSKTVLQFIKENNLMTLSGKELNISGATELNGNGTAGANRCILYRVDASAIEMRIPRELDFIAGQINNFDVKFPGSYLYQGVWLKRLDSLRYLDVPA